MSVLRAVSAGSFPCEHEKTSEPWWNQCNVALLHRVHGPDRYEQQGDAFSRTDVGALSAQMSGTFLEDFLEKLRPLPTYVQRDFDLIRILDEVRALLPV